MPLLLSPLVLFALAEGWVDLGGGEKDLIFILPYGLWALVFFLAAVTLISKRWAVDRWLLRATIVATGCLAAIGLATYWVSWLGIA